MDRNPVLGLGCPIYDVVSSDVIHETQMDIMDIACDANSGKETENGSLKDEQSEVTDMSVEIPSTMECDTKSLSVHSLETSEDLSNACEDSGLKFMDCPPSNNCDKITVNDQVSQHKLKNCSVNCLQSLEDLAHEGILLGLQSHGFIDKYCPIYEVDLILADKVEEGEKKYLVKWDKYAIKYSTWEPLHHFTDGKPVMYYEWLRSSSDPTPGVLQYFLRDLFNSEPYDLLTVKNLYCLIFHPGKDGMKYMKLPPSYQKVLVKQILDLPVSALLKIKDELLEIMKLAETRKLLWLQAQEWENKRMSITVPCNEG